MDHAWALEIRNVDKIHMLGHYRVPALKGISLRIPRGEITLVSGPSGCGKTTLLNILGLLGFPSAGQLFFFNRLLTTRHKQEILSARRFDIGFVFQDFFLIPSLTVLENVAYPLGLLGWTRGERSARVVETLEQTGLTGLAHKLPGTLSTGERQRVAVARAVVKKPKLILADEPTANLDSHMGRAIFELLDSINTTLATTIVVATHDPRALEREYNHIRLRDGKLVEESECLHA